MKKKNEQWLRYSNRALSGLLMLFDLCLVTMEVEIYL